MKRVGGIIAALLLSVLPAHALPPPVGLEIRLYEPVGDIDLAQETTDMLYALEVDNWFRVSYLDRSDHLATQCADDPDSERLKCLQAVLKAENSPAVILWPRYEADGRVRLTCIGFKGWKHVMLDMNLLLSTDRKIAHQPRLDAVKCAMGAYGG